MGAEQIADFVYRVALSALPLLMAVIFHEVSHGVVALWLGDDTAKRAGRLTLNPLPHIDPVGTVLLPALLLWANLPVFGYAKPVPVDYRRLREPRRGMVLVALAGPLTNVALAIASAVVLRQLIDLHNGFEGSGGFRATVASSVIFPLAQMAIASTVVNIVLAVFNLIPIPPLDGGRVATGILPSRPARMLASVEPFGFLIIMALLMTGTLQQVIDPAVRLVRSMLL